MAYNVEFLKRQIDNAQKAIDGINKKEVFSDTDRFMLGLYTGYRDAYVICLDLIKED